MSRTFATCLSPETIRGGYYQIRFPEGFTGGGDEPSRSNRASTTRGRAGGAANAGSKSFDRKVRDLRHSRSLEIVNGSKPNDTAGISRTTRRGYSRSAVRWPVSPHPSPLPWGEGEPLLAAEYNPDLSAFTARCALFPLPEGEGQGEGKRRKPPAPVSNHSWNCRAGRVLRRSRSFLKRL